MEVIKVGDFCEVLDSQLAEYGVKKGDLAYIAGSSLQPTDKDFYTLCTVFIATKMRCRHVVDDTYFIDPKRLKKLSAFRQKSLRKILEEDFKPKEAADGCV
jgi:hypothetical protein